jgi:hypothetical protein
MPAHGMTLYRELFSLQQRSVNGVSLSYPNATCNTTRRTRNRLFLGRVARLITEQKQRQRSHHVGRNVTIGIETLERFTPFPHT